MEIHNSRFWLAAQNLVPNSLHQVCFAQTNATVHKQRVIAFSSIISNLRCCRLCKLVRFSLDKGIESELSIEVVRCPHQVFTVFQTLFGVSSAG